MGQPTRWGGGGAVPTASRAVASTNFQVPTIDGISHLQQREGDSQLDGGATRKCLHWRPRSRRGRRLRGSRSRPCRPPVSPLAKLVQFDLRLRARQSAPRKTLPPPGKAYSCILSYRANDASAAQNILQ